MSNDWSTCKNCQETYIEGGDDMMCQCGNKYCSEECGEDAGVKFDEEKDEYSCAYCRGEIIEDSDLLNFILTECEISREEVEDKYREKHKEA